MRPEATAFLEDADCIVHAGDIGAATILRQLRTIAPLYAIRGNNDTEDWAARIPERRTLRLGGLRLHIVHDRAALAREPAPDGTRVIVMGHSHQPLIESRNGVLLVNPGSAGPRRFRLPIAAGEIDIRGTQLQVRLVDLTNARCVTHELVATTH